MMIVSTLRWKPGKQESVGFGIGGSVLFLAAHLYLGARRVSLRLAAHGQNQGFATAPMPNAADTPLLYAFCCFPPASPAFAAGAGKQKTIPMGRFNRLISLRKFGAGEGIRTLDPNLGKVATSWPLTS
ncbi:MAG: hypothetical protein ACREC9_13635 [Methylocella sp.]